METIKNYLHRLTLRRLVVMLVGVVFTGWGIATFRFAVLGTDPFTAMNLALSEFFHMDYPTFQIVVNLIFFVIQLLWGRSLLGLGTIANAFGLAYVMSFFYAGYQRLFPAPDNIGMRFLILIAGLLILSLGLSMYQKADLGVAPYDAIPLILTRKLKGTPFFLWRVIADGTCALISFLTGGVKLGVLGIGTVIVAFGMGPVIQLCDNTLTARMLGKDLSE